MWGWNEIRLSNAWHINNKQWKVTNFMMKASSGDNRPFGSSAYPQVVLTINQELGPYTSPLACGTYWWRVLSIQYKSRLPIMTPCPECNWQCINQKSENGQYPLPTLVILVVQADTGYTKEKLSRGLALHDTSWEALGHIREQQDPRAKI